LSLFICLMFQLYPGGQFYWRRKPEYQEKTTDLSQVTDKLDHIILYTSPWSRFELTTSVVIDTDYMGSWKSNYHTIMATTAPEIDWFLCGECHRTTWPVATFVLKKPTPFFSCVFRVGSSVISYQNDVKLKSFNQWTNRPFLRDAIWVRLTKDKYFDSKLHVVAKFVNWFMKTLVRWWCKGILTIWRKNIFQLISCGKSTLITCHNFCIGLI
jgi:hypothetical protein